MHKLVNAYPLYNFIKYCNNSSLPKKVLDCGAGGRVPPLSLFKEFGYETYGIDICKEQLKAAEKFCNQHNLDLNIVKGDMLDLPFRDGIFSFLFSYNTTVHMRKKDFQIAINEFYRVMQPEGLCYVNFLTKECDTYGEGEDLGEGSYLQVDAGEEVLYTHYNEEDLNKLLKNFRIIYREKRAVERFIDGEIYKSSYIDFILLKN